MLCLALLPVSDKNSSCYCLSEHQFSGWVIIITLLDIPGTVMTGLFCYIIRPALTENWPVPAILLLLTLFGPCSSFDYIDNKNEWLIGWNYTTYTFRKQRRLSSDSESAGMSYEEIHLPPAVPPSLLACGTTVSANILPQASTSVPQCHLELAMSPT